MSNPLKNLGRQADPAQTSYQYLEDLATAYWYSETLFCALELGLFDLLEENVTLDRLTSKTGWDGDALERLLKVLTRLGLTVESEYGFINSLLTQKFLLKKSPDYLGHFLTYRQYFAAHWRRLGQRTAAGPSANQRPEMESDADYQKRVDAYVQAMDAQARLKIAEARPYLNSVLPETLTHILDVGGGGGAWSRGLLEDRPQARAVLLEMPEVLFAASRLYNQSKDWQRLDRLGGDGRQTNFRSGTFDLVILSNVLHAYGASEASSMLERTAGLLAPEGMVLIHDYLTEEQGPFGLKGDLYDLHMLANTYNGRIYSLSKSKKMLVRAGLFVRLKIDLETDSSIILAQKNPVDEKSIDRDELTIIKAREMGFSKAALISTDHVATAPWVWLKCGFGCLGYNKNHHCPPHSPDEEEMKRLLSSYQRGLLIEGQPPSRNFHQMLLELERFCFLHGFHKALAFGAGPCTLCRECDLTQPCRQPEKARPALEACGVDVYETARQAGWYLEPLAERRDYVKYIGLVLLD